MSTQIQRITLVTSALSILICACEEGVDTADDLQRWLQRPEHGLIREQTVAGIRWTVNFLPDDYLGSRYLESLDRPVSTEERDSILRDYETSICILLSVASDNESQGDVLAQHSQSPEQLESQARAMNYDMKNYVELHYGGKTTPAVISTMENSYGLRSRRDMMIVFAKDRVAWDSADSIECVLDDGLFGTGRHSFVFLKTDIEGIPRIGDS